MNIIIKSSNKPDKKYDAIIVGKKTISVGAKGMSDYTKHKDKDKKDYLDIKIMKCGPNQVLTLPVFGLAGCFGISQPLKKVIMI